MSHDHHPLAALFLGPKAENEGLFEQLLVEALRDHAAWRRAFHPQDPHLVPAADRQHPDHPALLAKLTRELRGLRERLKGAVPFFSPRYLGHMASDLSMSGLLGYFAAMLYNPNNVSAEASPVGTQLELEVGAQLARGVGYPAGRHWAHLTSGGTVANAEALWIARELKYLPIAVRWAAAELGISRTPVKLPTGELADLNDLDLWQLLNIAPGSALHCAEAFQSSVGDVGRALAALSAHSLSGMGYQAFGIRLEREHGDALPPSVVLAPATAHYSWRKLSRALGIGANQLIRVPVDERFRMDLAALKELVASLQKRRQAILACVSVVGSTEESAVDPVHEVAALRADWAAERALTLFHHADAAWGGYAVAATLDESGRRIPYDSLPAGPRCSWPSQHVYAALCGLADTDSVTIDPHKLGYVPYPAGAICFRDMRVRNLVAVEAPYVFHSGDPDSAQLGRFIFEGSKPGAAAAAVWLTHRVIPFDATGYGRIITRAAQAAHALRQKLIEAPWGPLRVVPLPAPDINILCFAVGHERLRTLGQVNELCRAAHAALSLDLERPGRRLDFLATMTQLSREEYGDALLPTLRALEVDPPRWPREGLNVLRCTVMNPFLSGDAHVDWLFDGFVDSLRGVLLAAAARILDARPPAQAGSASSV